MVQSHSGSLAHSSNKDAMIRRNFLLAGLLPEVDFLFEEIVNEGVAIVDLAHINARLLLIGICR
jgi:hypothetical protein